MSPLPMAPLPMAPLPMAPLPMAAALADVATLGPVFAVSTGAPPDVGPAGADPATALEPPWRPLVDLMGDPGALRAQVDAARAALGGARADVEDRVAAAFVFGGLAARLVAPVLAVAVLHGRVPDLDPGALHWRPRAGGVVPLWIADPGERPADPDTVHDAVIRPTTALAGALRARTRVSERLLHGEVAVAVAKVTRILARERPSAAGAARTLATALLDRPPLVGTLHRVGEAGEFRRRTCCLAYRVPGGRLCADCVLSDRSGAPARAGRSRPPR